MISKTLKLTSVRAFKAGTYMSYCFRFLLYTVYFCICILPFFKSVCYHDLSCNMTKPTKWFVRPVKTQISLGIRPVWSESSLCAQWVAKDPSFLHADSKDSDQTGRMPRLIWVFAGRRVIMLALTWGSSFIVIVNPLWLLNCTHL